MAYAFASLLNEEARGLEGDGVDIVQFDEPAFNVYMDDAVRWGVDALQQAAQGLRCKTAVHICYGYGIEANVRWKEGLGQEWRQYEQVFPALAASSIDQVSLECANSRVPPHALWSSGATDSCGPEKPEMGTPGRRPHEREASSKFA